MWIYFDNRIHNYLFPNKYREANNISKIFLYLSIFSSINIIYFFYPSPPFSSLFVALSFSLSIAFILAISSLVAFVERIPLSDHFLD